MRPPWETRAEVLERFDDRIAEAKRGVVEAQRVRDAVSDLVTSRPGLDVTGDDFAGGVGLIFAYEDAEERSRKRIEQLHRRDAIKGHDGTTWELTRHPHGAGGQQAGTPDMCFRCVEHESEIFHSWRTWDRSIKVMRDAIRDGRLAFLAGRSYPTEGAEFRPLSGLLSVEYLLDVLLEEERIFSRTQARIDAIRVDLNRRHEEAKE